jgi:A nuclease family of the HNH/ENDO VII superfamily with conserved AHH
MKKIIKNRTLLIVSCLAILFFSCEKDLYENAIKQESATKGKTEFVKIEDVPFLVPSLIEYNSEYDYLKKDLHHRDNTDASLDLDNILEYVYANNIKTYSVQVIKEFQPTEDKYFENLYVFQKNGIYDSFILKYNPSDDTKAFDLKTFTGQLDIYDKNNVSQGIIQYENGLNKCEKLILGDWVIIFWGNGDISVGGGPGGGGTVPYGSSWTGAGPTGGVSVSTATNSSGSNLGQGNNNSTQNNSTSSPYTPIPVFVPYPSVSNPAQFIHNLGTTNSAAFNLLSPESKDLLNVYIQQNLYNAEELLDLKTFLSNATQTNSIAQLSTQTQLSIFNYLIQNSFLPNSVSFANEVTNLAVIEPNQADVENLTNLTILLENSGNTLLEDSFALTLDPYVDLDLHDPLSPLTHISLKIFFDYRKNRQLNPEWSRAKCMWYASKEIVHLSLDAFGLIPVAGEVADLINGGLYVIEGDGLNASLSFASTIPIAGWAATGTKYAVKIKTVYATGTKVKHVWKVLANGTIYFGTNNTCRAQLRKALGMVVGNLNQAHHIIPLNLQNNPIVQKAFKSAEAFHLNEALNGISLSTLVHSGSHGSYDDLIEGYLNAVPANATPSECFNAVNQIIDKVRTAIANNPTTKVNDLIF